MICGFRESVRVFGCLLCACYSELVTCDLTELTFQQKAHHIFFQLFSRWFLRKPKEWDNSVCLLKGRRDIIFNFCTPVDYLTKVISKSDFSKSDNSPEHNYFIWIYSVQGHHVKLISYLFNSINVYNLTKLNTVLWNKNSNFRIYFSKMSYLTLSV